MQPCKLKQRIPNGSLNVRFAEMCRLVEVFGFRLVRVSGRHPIYAHPDVRELVNLQEVNGQAKPYQIRQFLKLPEEHNLTLEDDEP